MRKHALTDRGDGAGEIEIFNTVRLERIRADTAYAACELELDIAYRLEGISADVRDAIGEHDFSDLILIAIPFRPKIFIILKCDVCAHKKRRIGRGSNTPSNPTLIRHE